MKQDSEQKDLSQTSGENPPSGPQLKPTLDKRRKQLSITATNSALKKVKDSQEQERNFQLNIDEGVDVLEKNLQQIKEEED